MQLPINIGRSVGAVAQYILQGHKRAVKYLDADLTVKATRFGRYDKRDHQIVVVVTVGRPNYLERRFIKLAKKAGEPFPIKKIQIR